VTRQDRTFSDRAARRALGGWALAAVLAGCALAAAPAGATDDPPAVHLVPGLVVGPAGGGDDHPGPGGSPPGRPDKDDDDAPRPVAPRPTAGVPVPGAADALAVRSLPCRRR